MRFKFICLRLIRCWVILLFCVLMQCWFVSCVRFFVACDECLTHFMFFLNVDASWIHFTCFVVGVVDLVSAFFVLFWRVFDSCYVFFLGGMMLVKLVFLSLIHFWLISVFFVFVWRALDSCSVFECVVVDACLIDFMRVFFCLFWVRVWLSLRCFCLWYVADSF